MTKKTIGVIVGRFQVPTLHPGHRYLIQTAMDECNDVCLLIGDREAERTDKDPMNYETRTQMIKGIYPFITTERLLDHPCDEAWSENLDSILDKLYPDSTKILYGSRNSFVPSYHGRHEAKVIPEYKEYSGTKFRDNAAKSPIESEDFRRGVIYAQTNRFPVSFQVADVALLDGESQNVLLGRKTTDDGWRFLGGFVDPTDESLELSAKREVYEETGGLETDDYRYIGSARIDDHRYRGQRDQIMTVLFAAKYIFGAPKPSDDIAELCWKPVSELDRVLIKEHKHLGKMLKKYLSR